MDSYFWLVLGMAVTMAGVSWHAHRIGNERRDVALLGVFAAILGVGSGVIALI